MTTAERIEVEIAKLAEVLRRRGQFFDDEQARYQAMLDVRQWLEDDRVEAERARVAAIAAEEEAKRIAYENDPNRKTKDLFNSYNGKLSAERGASNRRG